MRISNPSHAATLPAATKSGQQASAAGARTAPPSAHPKAGAGMPGRAPVAAAPAPVPPKPVATAASPAAVAAAAASPAHYGGAGSLLNVHA